MLPVPPDWVVEALQGLEGYEYVWADLERDIWLAVWVQEGGDTDIVGFCHSVLIGARAH